MAFVNIILECGLQPSAACGHCLVSCVEGSLVEYCVQLLVVGLHFLQESLCCSAGGGSHIDPMEAEAHYSQNTMSLKQFSNC